MKQLEQIEIGRYHIQRHLARGGMADVYLARDSEKDQIVAIKMVHENAGEYCERFQREVKVMVGLVHEHVLPIFDYGEYESWHFLVTPYIEYGTLNSRLTAGPLTPEEVDPILAQLAAALHFAHEQGVVHRDVKPSNVLMRDGNHVYLADFGLIKRVGQENGLTVTGCLVGTPEYMAPELAEEDATPQSDVYALGVLIYQMLAGRVPFKANTPIGVFLRHIRNTPEPPSTFNAAIPTEVEEVILRAMEKNPRRRYQSAQELYRAYQQAVKDASIRRKTFAARPTHISDNKLIQGDDVNKVDIKVRKQRGKVRRPLLATALLVAFLLGGVFVLVDSAFAPAGRENSIHAASARDAKDRQTSMPAVKRVTPSSVIDSVVDKRPAMGASSGNAIGPASSTNLNRSSESSAPQQTINAVGGSSQSSDTIGGSGRGTTNDRGSGNGGGSGSGRSGGGGQSTGSGGDQGVGSNNGQGDEQGGENGQGKGKGHGGGKGNGSGQGKGKGHDKGNEGGN